MVSPVIDIPHPWAQALVSAGFVDSRYADHRPSLSRLAEAAGLHTTTVSRMIQGKSVPDPGNVQAVAEALRLDPVLVSEWVDQARTVTRPYQPPSEVNLLTEREQAAVTELIRAMAAAKERDGSGNAAPTSKRKPRAVKATRSPARRTSATGASQPPP